MRTCFVLPPWDKWKLVEFVNWESKVVVVVVIKWKPLEFRKVKFLFGSLKWGSLLWCHLEIYECRDWRKMVMMMMKWKLPEFMEVRRKSFCSWEFLEVRKFVVVPSWDIWWWWNGSEEERWWWWLRDIVKWMEWWRKALSPLPCLSAPHRHTGLREASRCSLVLTNQRPNDNLPTSNDHFTAPVFLFIFCWYPSLDDLVVTVLGLQVVS